MSRMTYLEAIEYVLAAEMELRPELIVLRPGARPALEEDERDIALPRMGRSSFSVALGASMAGMHPVLDLRQEPECADLLLEAVCDLPADTVPEMTILTGAEEAAMLMELPGGMALHPKTPRQAAGFARAALRSSKMTLLMIDQAFCDEEDEIPGDSDFMMLPLDGTENADEAEADGEAAEGIEAPEVEAEICCDCTEAADDEKICAEESGESDGDAAAETDEDDVFCAQMTEAEAEEADEPEKALSCEAEEEPDAVIPGADEAAQEECPPEEAAAEEEAPCEEEPEEPQAEEERRAERVFCSSRMAVVSLARLKELACLLGMPVEKLACRCMEHAVKNAAAFDWMFEPDAEEGECAFPAPAGEKAMLWLGYDRLSISYDAEKLSHAQAGALLRAVRRVVEKPELLIYDKECETE